jgi:predicted MFS family arabinose efflux permease
MNDVLAPGEARRVFLLLTATRWLPVGTVIGLLALFPLERGLTVPQVMTYVAAQGVAVALLELPTSGFADAFGRRPVLLAAGAINVIAAVAFVLAESFWAFAAAAFLMGVYRALDSGPLEAWYVDTVHQYEPGADVDRDLAHQGVVVGGSIAATAVLSGVLIALDPVDGWHPFTLPLLLFVALCGVHLVATAALLREPPRGVGSGRAWASVRNTPVVVRDGVQLVRRNRVLGALIAVELFWATGMVVFEQFQSIRLAELLGSQTEAGAWSGPVGAIGWGVFAVGSGLAGKLTPRLGVARTAILARVLNGLGALVMGLVAGPVALVLAFLVTYSLHGLAGAPHMALLHREATASNRATVLSLNSLVGFAAFAIASPVLGHLAGATTTQTAMVAAGAFSVLGALLYLPADRKERAPAPQQALLAA